MPRIVSILSALLLLLAACSGGESSRALLRAEQLMEQHPDSALAILDSISPSSLTSDASRAKYALLLTQAWMKNNDFNHSDSLINTAVAYYDGEGNADEMKSLFYQGNIRYFNSEYSSAIIPALRAHDLAIKLNDDYWRAKTAEQIADIYTATYYDDYEYRKEAIDYYEKAGRIDNHRYAICDLAVGIANSGDYNRAIKILDSIAQITKTEHPIDSNLFVYSAHNLLPLHLRLMRTDSANIVYEELIKYGRFFNPSLKDYEYIAELELNNGNDSLAYSLLSNLSPLAKSSSQKICIYDGLIKYYKHVNELPKALDYTDSIFNIQNKEIYQTLKQSIITKQRDELKARVDYESREARTRSIILYFISIILIISVIGIIAYYSARNHAKNLEIEEKINNIYILSKTIEQQQDDLNLLNKKNSELHDNMHDTIHILFKDRWAAINMMCNQFYDNDYSESGSKRIVKNLDSEIQKLRSPQNLLKIEDAVNLYMDNIIYRLRQQCTFLKADEITLITLIVAGLSSRAVCMFTSTNYKYFFVKKKRILEKIMNSSAPDKVLFKSYLS